MSTRSSFDVLLDRLAREVISLSERELLKATHWDLGEDARLREDVRFRETPWGRWMLADQFLANDALFRELHRLGRSSLPLRPALEQLSKSLERPCLICPGDPRFALRGDDLWLAASELSLQPALEDPPEQAKYVTHLPLHSLRAAAASQPQGEWGPSAQEQSIETLGWVRVSLSGHRLNDRMFIGRIEGHSMDNGRNGLPDGGYAVFELWPTEPVDDKPVLVRGRFRDPETGAYAVKKFVVTARDPEGHLQRVALVSLNPDKERYPDIELAADDEEAVTVVAKVVQALSVEDYERRPKVRHQVGRRTLTGPAGLLEQAKRLGQCIASFFDPAWPPEGEDDSGKPLRRGWQTRLVCLDLEAGGPQLEVGPLDGLPFFVKKLRVVGSGDWDGVVLAANARSRAAWVPVRAGTGPWRWQAVGYEEDSDLGLEQLSLGAPDASAATVFRIDAEGVGQCLSSSTLALGQAYRILLPPGVGERVPGEALGDDWRLWSLDLSMPPSAATRAALTALNLQVGEPWPRLSWAVAPPAAWRTSARGESYPVFEAGTEVLLSVSAVPVDEWDMAMLFLHGQSGTSRLELPQSGIVSLGAPAEGRWACALLHPRTAVQSTTLVFEVARNAAPSVAARCSVTAPDGVVSLEISAPPGWPVALRWRQLHEEPLFTLHAGDDGRVELEALRLPLEARARQAHVADLLVDLGDLGLHVLAHEASGTAQTARDELRKLWRQRAGLVKSRVGAWLQLLPTWFEPVVRLWGYGLEPLEAGAGVRPDGNAPDGLPAWRLMVDEREGDRITRSTSRVLVLTDDLDGVLSAAQDQVDRACQAAQVREALITDGVQWTLHRRGSRLRRHVWNLGEAIEQDALDPLLAELAEGLK